jgi:ubiquinone/menaquinone biosynthesis C-methylase UbiE
MNVYKEWAELYDLLYGTHGQNKDVPFLLNLVRKYGGHVLECACGTGRVLIPIAEAGFKIHGIDTSEEMLGVLKKRVSRLPKDVRKNICYEKMDMRDFDLGKRFRTCIIPFTSLYHLETDSDMRKFLKSVRKHLEEKGILIIDVFDFNPETPQGRFVLHVEAKSPDGRVMKKYGKTVFGKNQVNDCWFKIVVEEKGKKREIRQKFRLHYLLHDQMWKLLEKEGFRVISVYGNYDSGPYHVGKPNERMIFVSEKI